MGIYRGTGGTGDSTTDTTVTTVTEKAAEAASSATSAANSATSAANSASSASTSATNAATSESNSATSATASATSATASETAKTSAQAAQTAAETAQANAETAEANAVTAKNQAVSAKDNAVTAQTAAETAETNAETAYANTLAIFGSATDVQNAVDDAEKLAINPEDSQYTLSDTVTTGYSALHYAAKAEDYKTAAEVSKNAAETAETAAETAQGLAETAQTAAETAQSAAETAQAAAELAQSNAETVYDNFDDRYLGNKSGDPLVDNDNEGLTTGTLYFNTTENEMRVYTGTAWVAVQELSGDQTVNSLTSNNNVVVKGNLEVQGTTITVDSATAQTIDLGDNDKIRLGDTDDLQIYHDGTDSYIANTTGTLKLSGNTDVTGNITVSGTVDGRDIATDGATLDAVASTYVDVSGDTLTGDLAFGDNVKAKFGASDDLQIYHTSTLSQIQDSGTGELRISSNGTAIRLWDTANLQNLAVFNIGGKSGIYFNGSEKLATTSSGVDVTGTVVADGLTIDGDVLFDKTTSGANKVQIDALGGNNSRLVFSENNTEKYNIGFQSSGASFTIYHSAGNAQRLQLSNNGDISFYEDTGTTAKFFWDASEERLQIDASGNARGLLHLGHYSHYDYTVGTDDIIAVLGAVSTGEGSANQVIIGNSVYGTGGTESLSLTFANTHGNADFPVGYRINSDVNLGPTTSTSVFKIQELKRSYSAPIIRDRLSINQSGDIAFYDDSSSSQDLYWDASTSRLGIGTTTPSAPLDINGSGTIAKLGSAGISGDVILNLNDGRGFIGYNGNTLATVVQSGAAKILDFRINSGTFGGGTRAIKVDSNNDISFHADDGTSQDFYWDASTSRLGLGTTSPSGVIHAVSSGVSNFIFQGADVGEGTLFQIRNATNNSATGNGHRLEFVHGNNNDRNVFFRTSSSGTFGRSPVLYIGSQNDTGGTELDHIEVQAGGDVAFYNDVSTSKDFYWDASTSRLGLGTTGPNTTLHLYNTGGTELRIESSANSDTGLRFQGDRSWLIQNDGNASLGGADYLHIYDSTAGASRLVIDTSGNVGIATTSPSTNLDVEASSTSDGIHVTRSGATRLKMLGDGTIKWGASANQGDLTWDTGLTILKAESGNDLSFKIGSSEAMRIDSSGRLGIGTTSPSAPLQVHYTSATPSTSAGDAGLVLRGSSTLRTLFGSDPASPYGGWIQNTNDAGTGTFPICLNPEGGNVSIGTKTASSKFNITQGSDTSVIQRINGADETSEYLGLGVGASEAIITAGNAGAGSTALVFEVSSSGTESEAARIDSSGNLLVGRTVNSTTDYGTTVSADGYISTSRDGNPTAYFNRQTSDGEIVQLRKDGTTVGSIGVDYSDNLFISGNSSHSGLSFGTVAVIPYANGDVRDGTEDLGDGAYRWRNLYLSGGVYLGGTGSANLLDDYEEGTSTVDASGLTINYSYSSKVGKYTKIGDTVIYTFRYEWTTTNKGSGDTVFNNLPFVSTADGYVHLTECNANISADQIYGEVISGTNDFKIYGRNNASTTLVGPVQKSAWTSDGGSFANIIAGIAIYKA